MKENKKGRKKKGRKERNPLVDSVIDAHMS